MIAHITQVQRAAEALRQAKHVVALTGAGMSQESGVPTFRDAVDGLWARFDPMQLATREAFQADPKLVWEWYEYRRGLMRGAKPNAGHDALAKLQQRFESLTVITQNVDDMHEQSGSQHIIRLHGSIAQNKCFNDCQGKPTLIDISSLSGTPPACPHCGAHVRPNVVWFGELLPIDQINAAYTVLEQCDALLIIGTSGMVNPAAQMPIYAKRFGATLIEINTEATPITRIADVHLRGASGELLPQIVAALDEHTFSGHA